MHELEKASLALEVLREINSPHNQSADFSQPGDMSNLRKAAITVLENALTVTNKL